MPRSTGLNPYSVHPGVLATQTWIQTLPEKTGRSLEEWLRFVQEEGPPTEKERRDWLKAEHKLGTNSAWWIAERSLGKGEEAGDPETYLQAALEYVDAMLAGPKAALRPIYYALLDLGLSTGPDVKACPCQTIVPLYRNHVFAQIKPTTRTRIDFGLALKDTPATGRLLDTGGFAKKDRISHRIPISSVADIDEEVRRWLKRAYEMDA
ncbi:MAG TPA: DUF5655 domain-containing protein [Thermoanaerobaculia bacterium]|nr:DUF5655 domain-containing protein [Thermoanaerobaculia bacterium]